MDMLDKIEKAELEFQISWEKLWETLMGRAGNFQEVVNSGFYHGFLQIPRDLWVFQVDNLYWGDPI